MDPKQTPNANDTKRIITPRRRIFQTPASSAPSKLPAATAEITMPYTRDLGELISSRTCQARPQ
jgi:hypothetical protein